MPSLFLALTIISGLSFTLALAWVIAQWLKIDEEVVRAEKDLSESLRRIEVEREGEAKPSETSP